jgi:hypothetical protein
MCLAIALSIQDSAGSAPQLSMPRPHDCATLPSARCSVGPYSLVGVGELPSMHSEQIRDVNKMRGLPMTSGCCSHTLPCFGQGPALGGVSCCSVDRSTASLSRPQRRYDMCCAGSLLNYGFPSQSNSGELSLSSSSAAVESVFEPRPPHPVITLPAAAATTPVFPVERCALAHDETVTVLDPWRRRPSSLDHGRPRMKCVQSNVCCESSKCGGGGNGRRRSCGTRLSRDREHSATDAVYMSDRPISPAPCGSGSGSGGSVGVSCVPPKTCGGETSTERDDLRRAAVHQQDSIDLVISSEILESMLQGTAGYVVDATGAATTAAACAWDDGLQTCPTMPETVALSPAPAEPDQGTGAMSQFAVCSPTQPEATNEGQSDDGDAVFV